MSDDLTAAGGWCAPSEMLYTPTEQGPSFEFPTVTVQRGGSRQWFPAPGTPEWHRQQQDAERNRLMQRLVSQLVGDIMTAQNNVLDAACFEALHYGYDVHLYRHPYKATRFIGIELAPRTTQRVFPTVYEHTTDDYWDEDD